MTVHQLNEQILFEKDLAELQKKIELAKKELDKDLNIRIALAKIKEFVARWKDFTSKYDTSKFRISDIEQKGKNILKFLQKKINDLYNVKTVKKSDIKPLQDYLDDFRIEVEDHLDIEKKIYYKSGK